MSENFRSPEQSAASNRESEGAGGVRKQSGTPRNDLILSAHVAGNAAVFPLVLALHVPEGATVADVTHGKGVFWRNVDAAKYRLLATDIKHGVDCRKLPYEAGTIDAVVLDPPYMEGASRKSAYKSGHQAFSNYYGLQQIERGSDRYHAVILRLYLDACAEATRVLKPSGVLIVKCQDEVSANRQRLTHVEIITALAKDWFCKDLFVVVRTNRPGCSRILKQVHARKNHSYFLVFVRAKDSLGGGGGFSSENPSTAEKGHNVAVSDKAAPGGTP